jgi:conjugative transposon TraN protein
MRNYRNIKFSYLATLFISLFLFIDIQVYSQEIIPVELAQNKTVHLFFTSPVKFCDSGSGDITFKNNENIVTLTATKADFAETNLTVVTTDNLCYSFLLLYSSVPRQLNLNPDPKKAKLLKTTVSNGVTTDNGASNTKPPAVKPVKPTTKSLIPRDSVIFKNCKKLIAMDPAYQEIAIVQKQVGLMLSNVFVDDTSLYVSFYILNNSKKVFNQSFINFQIIELKGLLFTKVRDQVKKPIFIYNKKESFPAQKTEQIVYVFNKFKVETGKKLCLEIGEKDGDRLLSVNIDYTVINKAPKIK